MRSVRDWGNVYGIKMEMFGVLTLMCYLAIALFNLCKERVQNGLTETSVVSAFGILGELIGIGAGSLVLAALVGYSSAYLLRVSVSLTDCVFVSNL